MNEQPHQIQYTISPGLYNNQRFIVNQPLIMIRTQNQQFPFLMIRGNRQNFHFVINNNNNQRRRNEDGVFEPQIGNKKR